MFYIGDRSIVFKRVVLNFRDRIEESENVWRIVSLIEYVVMLIVLR